MDAICYFNPLTQYTINNMVRELIKSYVSFRTIKSFDKKAYGVATGKWGCGAFNGDPQLKSKDRVSLKIELYHFLYFNSNNSINCCV